MQLRPTFSLCIIAMICGLAVTACAPTPERHTDAPVIKLNGKGYESEIYAQEHVTRGYWKHGDENVDYVLHTPALPGSFPLVVYLAGLGDTAAQASELHSAWAQSGYMVLSLQSPKFGPAAMAGAGYPGTNRHQIAARAYSPQALGQRLDTLEWALGKIRQLQSAPSADNKPFRHINMQQIVITGFDLGAQTAQVLAGESMGITVRPRLLESIRGFILLSPYVGFSGESATTRYRAMNLPVLAVSSPEDVDPFDWITMPAMHRQVFDRMPAGNKYYLELAYASHGVIGGGSDHALMDEASPGGKHGGRKADRDPGGKGNDSRPGGGGMGGGGPGFGGGPGAGDPQGSPRNGKSGDDRRPAKAASQQDQLTALNAVTLAFLDTTLRHDDIAAQWLYKDANRWLKRAGCLYLR